ncbi:MAG: HAMP domain-containing histidine kinase [Candidatus Hydrogenedentes bacterium]|nr:HAMP domain-containing histidine kinase [Candidatus Hydrogenedentota bacterium]
MGTLTRRVMGWMLIVCLLPLLIMAAQGYHCASEAVIETTNNQLYTALMGARAMINGWLEEKERELAALAANPVILDALAAQDIDSNTRNSVKQLLGVVKDNSGAYEDLVLIAPSGRVVARADDSQHIELGREALEAIREVSGHAVALGPPHVHDDGGVGVHAVHGVVSATGEIVGYLAGNLNVTRALGPRLEDFSQWSHANIYLLSHELDVMTPPRNRDGLSTTPGQPGLWPGLGVESFRRIAESEGEVVSLPGPDGAALLLAAAQTPDSGWYVVAEKSAMEGYKWLGRLARRASITGLLTLVALLLLSLWIAQRLGRPMQELARVALRIRAGQTGERLGPMPGGEAEEVRQTFNEMLDNLQENQRELVRTAALAGVGELSSSIVHEMRNPLSSIKMNLQALRRRNGDDPPAVELAEIAAGQVRRLEHMLNDLLQYGKPVALQPEDTPVAALFESARAVAASQAEQRGIRFVLRNELAERPLAVDRELLCRALTNVLLNAVQAAPDNSVVTIRGAEAAMGMASIEVMDEGPGLPNVSDDRLFRPFYTTKAEGTGLGLANVRKIVELHGGTVNAANLASGGAIITMILPLAAARGMNTSGRVAVADN